MSNTTPACVAVRVTCHEGTTWTTNINGTLETARAYFLGRVFTEENIATGAERHMRVTACDLVEPPKPKTYRVTLRYLVQIEVEADSEADAIEKAHGDAFTDGDIETLDAEAQELA